MVVRTDAGSRHLRDQRLALIVIAPSAGVPDVAAGESVVDRDTIVIGGSCITATRSPTRRPLR